MKQYLLLLGGLLPGGAVAQHLAATQVPAAVQQAFARAQPRVSHASWRRQGSTYQVQFRQQDELRGSMQLTPDGVVQETRLDISYGFPPLARTAMSERFPHRQIDRITRVVNATTGQTTYVALVCKHKDKNGKDKDCQASVFDVSGRPLAQ